jgi:hypothetical protein
VKGQTLNKDSEPILIIFCLKATQRFEIEQIRLKLFTVFFLLSDLFRSLTEMQFCYLAVQLSLCLWVDFEVYLKLSNSNHSKGVLLKLEDTLYACKQYATGNVFS